MALQDLIDGVQRFQRSIYPSHRELFEHLAHGQSPEVLFIACADSRVDPSLLTQSPPGKLFVLRNAGNLVPADWSFAGGEAATVAYAVDELEVHHIVVCGHSGCGAVTAALAGHEGDVIGDWLENMGNLREEVARRWPELEGDRRVAAGVHLNALMQLDQLRIHPSVSAAEEAGRLVLHAWVYDIGTGNVSAWDAGQTKFLPLAEVGAEKELMVELEKPEPPVEEGWLDHGPYRVALTSCGLRPFAVAEAVAQITSWDALTVKSALQELPVELLHGLTEMEVEVVKAWIEDAGGRVQVESDDA